MMKKITVFIIILMLVVGTTIAKGRVERPGKTSEYHQIYEKVLKGEAATYQEALRQWFKEKCQTAHRHQNKEGKILVRKTVDSNGWVNTQIVYQDWHGDWQDWGRDTFSYDPNGYMTGFLSEYSNGGQWILDYRETYTNDPNGNILLDVGEVWDGSQWMYDYRATFTNNAMGYPIHILREQYEDGVWQNNYQVFNTWDANGNHTEILVQDWETNGSQTLGKISNGGSWVNEWRATSTFVNNLLSESITEDWIADQGGFWEYTYRELYTYSSGLLIMYTTQTWGDLPYYYVTFKMADEDEWVNFYQETYGYNGNLMISIFVEMWWEDAWQPWSRTTIDYNANEQETQRLEEIYIGVGYYKAVNGTEEIADEDWMNSWLENYSYDTNSNLSEWIGQYWDYFDNWVNSEKELYTWQQVSTDVRNGDMVLHNYRLYDNYPNPFNPSTTIRFSISKPGHVSLKIYDLLGKEVATLVDEDRQADDYKIKWNAGNLPSGIYVYRLQTNGFVSAKKLVLQK